MSANESSHKEFISEPIVPEGGSFDAAAKDKTEIYVAGKTSKAKFDLWVYRAVPKTH